MSGLRFLVVMTTIYLPLFFGADGVVIGIDGHGQRVAIARDFAIVECANGATPVVAAEQNTIIVRCEHVN